MGSVNFTYTQDADTIYAFASNPEEVRRRSEALGETQVHVTEDTSGDTKVITNRRVVAQELPGFVKKIFSPTNTVTDTKHWTKTDDGYRASLQVDVQGAPTKVSGTITITPSASGCTYHIDYTATAKIPLIRKKLEAYIEEITEKGMRAEYAYNLTQLNA